MGTQVFFRTLLPQVISSTQLQGNAYNIPSLNSRGKYPNCFDGIQLSLHKKHLPGHSSVSCIDPVEINPGREVPGIEHNLVDAGFFMAG